MTHCKWMTSFIAMCSVTSALPSSMSSVYVQSSGADTAPYMAYGPPNAPGLASYAALSPYQALPCAVPCVSQPVATNAKAATYQVPWPQVLGFLPAKEDPRGYQYSYSVFDDTTGDRKAQTERSDGSVVTGQYSLVQPDGYLRHVLYSAGDDGFNAVVKQTRSQEGDSKKPDSGAGAAPKEGKSENSGNKENKETNEKKAEVEEVTASSKDQAKDLKEPTKGELKMNEDGDSKSSEKTTSNNKESADKVSPNDVVSSGKIVFTLQDLLRSLQNSLAVAPVQQQSPSNGNSPITYILFPALEKGRLC